MYTHTHEWECHTYVKEQGWDWGVTFDMDHAEDIRQVSLSGTHEEESTGGGEERELAVNNGSSEMTSIHFLEKH